MRFNVLFRQETKTAFSRCVRSGLWIIYIFSPADGKIHIYICRKINKTLWKSFQIFMIFSTWSEWTEWKYWVLNCCQVKVMNKATVTKEPKIKWNYKMTGIISMVFKFKIFSISIHSTFEIIGALNAKWYYAAEIPQFDRRIPNKSWDFAIS